MESSPGELREVTCALLGEFGKGKQLVFKSYFRGSVNKDDKILDIQESSFKREPKHYQRSRLLAKIVDSTGMEDFKAARINTCYIKVDVLIIVFDVMDRHSFDMCEKWVREANEEASAAKILLGINTIQRDSSKQIDGSKSKRSKNEPVSKPEGFQFISKFKLSRYLEWNGTEYKDLESVFETAYDLVLDTEPKPITKKKSVMLSARNFFNKLSPLTARKSTKDGSFTSRTNSDGLTPLQPSPSSAQLLTARSNNDSSFSTPGRERTNSNPFSNRVDSYGMQGSSVDFSDADSDTASTISVYPVSPLPSSGRGRSTSRPVIFDTTVSIEKYQSKEFNSLYKIINTIQEVPQDEVCVAEEIKTKVKYTVKQITCKEEEALGIFQKVEKLKEIQSVNIVGFVDYFYERPNRYIDSVVCNLITQHFSSGFLADILEDRRQKKDCLSTVEVLFYATQLSYGLRKLHEKGLVHRDFTTSNCFLSLHNSNNIDSKLKYLVHIIDFCQFDHKVTDVFASPEMRGQQTSKINQATDIFSFGVILFQLMTLQTQRILAKEVLKDGKKGTVNIKEQLEQLSYPVELCNIVVDCLDNDAQQRPQIQQIYSRCKDLFIKIDESTLSYLVSLLNPKNPNPLETSRVKTRELPKTPIAIPKLHLSLPAKKSDDDDSKTDDDDDETEAMTEQGEAKTSKKTNIALNNSISDIWDAIRSLKEDIRSMEKDIKVISEWREALPNQSNSRVADQKDVNIKVTVELKNPLHKKSVSKRFLVPANLSFSDFFEKCCKLFVSIPLKKDISKHKFQYYDEEEDDWMEFSQEEEWRAFLPLDFKRMRVVIKEM